MGFPVILSGPILRRVDRNSVYIWIAASKRFHIGAELFHIHPSHEDDPYIYQLVSDQSEMDCVRFGRRLFIYMIKIVPSSGTFPTEALLGYNLFFTSGSDTVDLSHFGLLEPGDDSLVYGSLKYPSFFIHEGKRANILYGSCRKLHGKGGDALVAGDMHLEETYHTVQKRPHSLFLLGDQIYADDVADPLVPLITSISRQLIGKEESLGKLDKRLETIPFRQSLHRIHGRKFIMEHFCRFTSIQSHNHLIQFSEYAVMYLLSWGPQVWEFIQENGGLPVFEEELSNGRIHFVFPPDPLYQKERQLEQRQHERRFAEQSEELRQSITVLKRVRRLLANVPSYMIFDDHDITDDWNISQEWKENVRNSPLGRHVIANGLGAYWAFQGWGNGPELFDRTFVEKIKRYAKTIDIESDAYQDWLYSLLHHPSWHFTAPTQPRTVFLDTRTKRGSDVSSIPLKIGRIMHESPQSPELISQGTWPAITSSLKESGWKKGEVLIIASPTPFYGIGLIESSLHSYVYPLRAVGIPVHQLFDFEAWKYNGKAFSTFLQQIFKWAPRSCLILSGDVHYASSVKTTVQSKDGTTAHIIQFTSSPVKNESFSGIWGRLIQFVLWLNALKRKNKDIIRYCDEKDRILRQDTQSAEPESYQWKESLAYVPTSKGSIIETNNNLGLLSITEESTQNELLTL
ncbi:hypothetical protein [Domibacillus tundrae]|uniref:hypothetical protein n=1 Tax=Domibacillus tundrae TaxID=1587527 RepID=UPI00339470DE